MSSEMVRLFTVIIEVKGELEKARAEARVYKEELETVRQDALRRDVMIMELTKRIPIVVVSGD